MTSHETDSGLALLKRLESWAKVNAIPLVAGDIRSLNCTEIELEWSGEDDEDSTLLAILERTDPYLVAVARLNLDRDTIEATIARYESLGGSDEEIEAARACFPFVGHVVHLEFSIFMRAGPVVLKYLFFAPWYGDAFGKFDEEEDDDRPSTVNAEWRAEQAERTKWNAAARSEVARRVSLDPRFPKAKSEAARVLITREVLGEDVPSIEHIVTQIGREAKAIFDLEKTQR